MGISNESENGCSAATSPLPLDRVRFGIFTFDPQTLDLLARGRRVSLGPNPSRILALLLSRPGELVTRRAIHRRLWGDADIDTSNRINFAISQLRSTLDQFAGQGQIETVPRRGYRFVGRIGAITEGRQRGRQRWKIAAMALRILSSAMLVRHSAPPKPSETVQTAQAGSEQRAFGRHFLSRGEVDRAATAFRAAIEIHPEDDDAHAGLAAALFSLASHGGNDQLERAGQSAHTALQINPDNAEALVVLAHIAMLREGDWWLAGHYLSHALGSSPQSVEALQAEATRLMLLGQSDAAIQTLELALAIDPVSTLLHTDLGWYLFMAGRYEAALDQCQRTLFLEPANRTARTCLVESYLQLGDQVAAAQHARLLFDVSTEGGLGEDVIGQFWNHVVAKHATSERPVSRFWAARALIGLEQTERARAKLVELASSASYPALFAPLHPVIGPQWPGELVHQGVLRGSDRAAALESS